LEGVYIADIDLVGILDDDQPVVDLDLSGASATTFEALQDDYALIFRVEVTEADKIKFYASEEPTEDLTINVKVVRE
jgi:hypothetical protein